MEIKRSNKIHFCHTPVTLCPKKQASNKQTEKQTIKHTRKNSCFSCPSLNVKTATCMVGYYVHLLADSCQNKANKQMNKQNKQTDQNKQTKLTNKPIIKSQDIHLHGGVHVRALVVTVASTVVRGSVLGKKDKTVKNSPHFRHDYICPEKTRQWNLNSYP